MSLLEFPSVFAYFSFCFLFMLTNDSETNQTFKLEEASCALGKKERSRINLYLMLNLC